MEREAILDFLKKFGLAINAFIGYPETHPVVKERVKETGEALRILGTETNTISMVFLENTVIIGEEKIDGSSFPIVSNIIRKFKKIGVESITMNVMAPDSDIAGALIVAAKPPLHIKNVKDPNELLIEKGIESITFNAVKVRIGSEDQGIKIETDTIIRAKKEEIESGKYDLDIFLNEIISGIIPQKFIDFIREKIEKGEIVSFLSEIKEKLKGEYGKDEEWVNDFFQNFFKTLPDDMKRAILESATDDIKEAIKIAFGEGKGVEESEDIERIKKDESVIVTDRITFEKMKQRLKDSFDLKDLSDTLNNIVGSLKSETKEVRINAYETLFKMMEDALEAGKEPFYLRIFSTLINSIKDEKDEDVFGLFSKKLSFIYNLCEKYGVKGITNDILNFFSEEINVKERRIQVLRALPDIKTTESLNLILSLLWEDVPVEELKNALLNTGMEPVKELMEMLTECDDKDVRLKILEIIPAFGEKSLDILKTRLRDDRWYVRRNVYYLLSKIGDKSVLNELKNLKEEEPRAREELLKTVYHLGGIEEEQFILNFIFDSRYEIAVYTLNILKNMVTKKSLPKIMQRFFINVFSTPMENNIKILLLDLLNELKDQRSFETLKKLITEKKMMSYAYPENIRVKACEVLSNLRGENILEFMKSLEKDKNPTIKEIATRYIKDFSSQQ
uniref:HEAT repeat domain-containing protein n=1 Tax=candidate division WOR-3 bacterium TaxID=2052148 RepID=A0A7C4YFG0_UNCW3